MPDWVLFFVVIVGIPTVCGVGADIFKRWVRLKEKQMTLAAETVGEHAAQYAAKIERLESRVQVLERIATDRGQDLALEIERLRPAALN